MAVTPPGLSESLTAGSGPRVIAPGPRIALVKKKKMTVSESFAAGQRKRLNIKLLAGK